MRIYEEICVYIGGGARGAVLADEYAIASEAGSGIVER